ncbi:hypothetical protein SAMN05660420_01890 [Desulfuromusa kysingii]|uniref:Uncharacterized protein n=1 Tax=Desulfuromusa kysingii TaxID=37625 RepID=A0A1H4ALC0_9BACT|nr:hypothetical protein [Desulfuromusa kysingii]SEA36720.1 hypothetical protein SAMN05660420_01890 [Desulfuromusa kysingii]
MRRKNIYKLSATVIALLLTAAFMLGNFGMNLTPLTKLFIIFFAGVIGLQCVPAVLLFICMVKGVCTVNQKNSLTKNGVKS